MAIVDYYTFNPLRPAYQEAAATHRTVRLPVGGVVGTAAPYQAGTLLGAVTYATPVSEVRTLTITGAPTAMTGYWQFQTSAGTYIGPVTTNVGSTLPTAAQMQVSADAVFGAGNTIVTGSASPYTLTFTGMLQKVRIGGVITFQATFTGGTTPAAAVTTATQGTCGEDQFDTYASGNSDGTQVPRCILERDYQSDWAGGNAGEQGAEGQPFCPPAFFRGFFFVNSVNGSRPLIGLDANALTANAFFAFRLVEGTSITAPNAVLHLS